MTGPEIDLEAKEDDELLHGTRAAQVLENEAFIGAVDALKARYRSAWEYSAWDDAQGREAAYRAAAALDEIVKQLRSVVTTGKMAEVAREHRAETEERTQRNDGSGGRA